MTVGRLEDPFKTPWVDGRIAIQDSFHSSGWYFQAPHVDVNVGPNSIVVGHRSSRSGDISG